MKYAIPFTYVGVVEVEAKTQDEADACIHDGDATIPHGTVTHFGTYVGADPEYLWAMGYEEEQDASSIASRIVALRNEIEKLTGDLNEKGYIFIDGKAYKRESEV